MTFNKKLLAATLVTAGGFAAISSANAATEDTFGVTMAVAEVCNITVDSAIDIALGTADNTIKTGTNAIQVFCSKGTPYKLALRPSNLNTGGIGILSRVGGVVGDETIGYKLTKGTTGTAWGNSAGVNTLDKSGLGAYEADSHTVTLTTYTSTDVPVGSYSDTVLISFVL